MSPNDRQRRGEGFDQDEARAAARERLERRRRSHEPSAKEGSESRDLAGHQAERRRKRGGDDARVIEANRPRSRRSSAEQSSPAVARSTLESAPLGLYRIVSWIASVLASLGRGILSWALRRPRAALACVLAAIVVFAGASMLTRSCSASREVAVPVETEQPSQEDQAEEPSQVEQADFSNLPASLDAQSIDALRAKSDDSRVVKIVNNAQALGADGETLQLKLLKLAAKDSQALDYVADYIDKYPTASGQPYKDSVSKGTIPDLKQWDERWGYVDYCGSALGLTGCCPTSLSMVYMGLTGKTDKTPADMAALATEDGYAIEGSGTVGDFLLDEASSLGLTCQYFWPSSASLEWYLENGFVVIVNVGPGDFTDGGHFFVAYGMASDGSVKINDPYSSVNTEKGWDADVIASQSMAMYAFKAL